MASHHGTPRSPSISIDANGTDHGSSSHVAAVLPPQAVVGSVKESRPEEEDDKEFGNMAVRKLERQLNEKSCVLHPESRNMSRWNTVILFFLMLSLVITPFDSAFGKMDDELTVTFVIGQIIDLVFTVDTVLQFFTMYQDPVENVWIYDRWRIIKNYLFGFFLFDLLSIIPFEAIAVLVMKSGYTTKAQRDWVVHLRVLQILRLARFLKILRLTRMKRLLASQENSIGLSFSLQIMIKAGLSIFITLHWFACIWACVGRYKYSHWEYNWLDMVKETKVSAGSHDGVRFEDPVTQYWVSLYWAAMTLTGVGYGDVNASNPLEFILCSFAQLFGALFWANFIANMIGIVSLLNQHEVRFQTTMGDLNSMMGEKHLPNDLKYRLREYFFKVRDFKASSTYCALLCEMSPGLQREVAYECNQQWLSKVWWLKGISERGFILELSSHLEHAIYAPKEWVIPTTPSMHIIQRGLCMRNCTIFGRGSIWGEDIILDAKQLRFNIAALSLTYLSVYALSKEDLCSAIQLHPDVRASIRHSAVQLAVSRGMRALAMQKKAEMCKERRRESGKGSRMSILGGSSEILLVSQQEKFVKRGKADADFNLWELEQIEAGKEEEERVRGEKPQGRVSVLAQNPVMGEEDQHEFMSELAERMRAVKDHVEDRLDIFDRRLQDLEAMLWMQRHANHF